MILNDEQVDSFLRHHGLTREAMTEEQLVRFLAHYGIKGMRWGVRRRRGPDGRVEGGTESRSAKPKKDRKNSEDKQRVVDLKSTKALNAMSNKEIQSVVTRANLESQYIQRNPNAYKKGMKMVGAVLAAGATMNQVIAFTKSPAGQHLLKTLRKGG